MIAQVQFSYLLSRRSMWAFFRVELEALQNWEEYRTIDFVPRLQPIFSSGKPDKDVLIPSRPRKLSHPDISDNNKIPLEAYDLSSDGRTARDDSF